MAISNLSSQYISSSYQNLLQVSSSGEIFNGSGTQVTSLVATSSFALSIPNTINGNLTVNGTLTANTYVVSSSVINETTVNVSGSTRFGNSIDDTHQYTGSLFLTGSARFLGNVVVSGSLTVTSSNTFTNYGPTILAGPVTITGIVSSSSTITGSLLGTASYATQALTASYALSTDSGVTINNNTNNYIVTATGTANTLNGESNLTFDGSVLLVTGSITARGSNNTSLITAKDVASDSVGFAVNSGDLNKGFFWYSQPVGKIAIGIGGVGSLYMSASNNGNNGFFSFNKFGSNAPVDILGNTIITGSLNVTQGITGSLLGTASYADQASTASYISPTFISASAAASGFGSGGGGTGSVTINNNVDNYLVTATGTANTLNGESGLTWDGSTFSVGNIYATSLTGTLIWSGSTLSVTGNVSATSLTGSLFGTSSWSENAVTASYVAGAASFPYTGTAAINGTLQVTGSVRLFDTGTTGLIEYKNGVLSTSARATVDFNLLGGSGASNGFILPLQQPGVAAAGSVYFDTGTGRLYIYDGTSWLYTQLS